jgi:16S rRNA (guanine527-N7)-methyltransferase
MSRAYELLPERCSEEKAEKMIHYMDEILRMNEFVNLTAVTDPEEFIIKHLLDSLSCIDSPEWKNAKTIADVGTGAGFPGVPLAIVDDKGKYNLIDSLRKRLRIIDDITAELGISNVKTFHLRAEEAGKSKEHREQYDLCVSRAVASMNVLAEWCLPLVKKGGTFIAYKGGKVEEEMEEAKKAIELLGGKVDRMEMVNLQDDSAENHVLVYIRKVKNTPAKYPRKAGTARKEPL